MSKVGALLATEGLGRDYGQRVAVASLDLEVGAGEIVGLLGPNGAGKTTAISMIAGVLAPTRGRARVGGADVHAEPFTAKRALGLVPQEIALYPDLTAEENLRFFAAAQGIGGGDHAPIDWALEVAGLAPRRADRVGTFSGGMQRRLNLAAGLVHRPRLLILDEPTVGIDPQSRHHIFETVRMLRAEHGISVLYTSHYMEEVQVLCDRVVILDGGRVVGAGRVDALIGEHASGLIEIELTAEAPLEAALAAARGIAGDGAVTATGSWIQIEVPERIAPLITAIESVADIASIRSAEANLETVFLHLTGHSLRD